MAWYLNHYQCTDCGTSWHDEWSCCCDDECPSCGSSDWSPHESEDLSEIVEEVDGVFVVYRSPDSAGHSPDYEAIARLNSAESAARFTKDGELIEAP